MKPAIRVAPFALPALLILVLAASALSNVGLPTRSQIVEQLGEAEKARLAEMTHLRRALGDRVWPGWGQADIPVIVYNEAYAFLVGYPGAPPEGWTVVPSGERRGGPWQTVPGDTFQGQPYYRQPLPDPDKTPENFTVRVGERWVATLQTREYSRVAFFAGFRRDLPPFLRPIVPYRLLWRLIMGDTETYIGALAHEAYHAYQGMGAPGRLAEAEAVARLEGRHPWDEAKEATVAELNALHEAARATSDVEAARLARQFLDQRKQRRAAQGLSPEGIDYERKREWLEGLAKYAELALQREAGRAPGYEPVPELSPDRDFHGYRTRERFWTQQLGEVSRSAHREGEVRFYYSGMAQAALLDRLMPDWKARAWDEGVWLEDLLAEAVQAID